MLNRENNYLHYLIYKYLCIGFLDLEDGGSAHFSKTVVEIKNRFVKFTYVCSCSYLIVLFIIIYFIFSNPNIMIECLVPDFRGSADHVKTIVDSGLDVFAHNVETVEKLTPFVRDRRANYRYTI